MVTSIEGGTEDATPKRVAIYVIPRPANANEMRILDLVIPRDLEHFLP